MSNCRIKIVALSLVLAFLLGACSNQSELTWTEDVKLPDGRMVTLKRWVEFKGGSSHLGDPSTESRQTFEFKHPETGEVVKWQNAIDQGRLSTIALWVDGGKLFLLGEPSYGGDSIKYNCPNPPYLLFEYVSGQWNAKPLAQISVKKIRSNLTVHPLERREEIEKGGRHLAAEKTSDSYTYFNGNRKIPYIIKFEGMPEQTFIKYENCDRPFNYLISVEGN